MEYLNKLILKESLIALIPTMLGFFVWISCIYLGTNFIYTNFMDNTIMPLMIIIWCIVMLSVTRIIPSPYTVSTQKEIGEDK
jgi:hypothetical protein